MCHDDYRTSSRWGSSTEPSSVTDGGTEVSNVPRGRGWRGEHGFPFRHFPIVIRAGVLVGLASFGLRTHTRGIGDGSELRRSKAPYKARRRAGATVVAAIAVACGGVAVLAPTPGLAATSALTPAMT